MNKKGDILPKKSDISLIKLNTKGHWLAHFRLTTSSVSVPSIISGLRLSTINSYNKTLFQLSKTSEWQNKTNKKIDKMLHPYKLRKKNKYVQTFETALNKTQRGAATRSQVWKK